MIYQKRSDFMSYIIHKEEKKRNDDFEFLEDRREKKKNNQCYKNGRTIYYETKTSKKKINVRY